MKQTEHKFAVFILTNGRPDKVVTYATLRRSGYTGPIYLLVDNLDKTKDLYVQKYGSEVIVFDKSAVAGTFDVGDNFGSMRGVIYARNAAFDIAKKIGFKYFIQLDDDYGTFIYRFDDKMNYNPKVIKNLDEVFRALVDFFVNSGADSVALAQGGDFIGGEEGSFGKSVQLRRKCMNSFICSTDRRFPFIGRINEDVNVYTYLATIGKIFFTANYVSLNQTETQTNSGGMTELYLDSGTYVKSFYTVIFQPSSVRVGILTGKSGQGSQRLHHRVSWIHTVPKILRESVKRKDP